MKCLELKNEKHIRLEVAFREWLEMTGYAACSVYGMPLHVREFLHYLEQNKKPLETLTPPDIGQYFTYLKQRRKKRRPGVFSISHLHKHLQALRVFSNYLHQTEQGGFDVDVALPQQRYLPRNILSKEEILRLYESCAHTPLGMRDRAMLSVFYGCGLRCNEAVHLDMSDFLQERSMLYVRKGKNHKERYVPLTQEVKQDLLQYLEQGRVAHLKAGSNGALFLSERGNRIGGLSLSIRLKQLLSKAGISKPVGLHALRHSIATHLLQGGMKLKSIGRFLGHSTLESTQRYTHIINEL